MSRAALWVVTVLLVLGAFYIFFVQIPGRQSELRQKGVREHGTVQFKDNIPQQDGTMVYTCTFIFPDKQKRNHQVNVQMLDKGRWDGLKKDADVIVYYLPDNPDKASIEGGEGLTAPHSSALSFLAWSMLIAAGVTGYMAYKAAPPAPKSDRKVTVTR